MGGALPLRVGQIVEGSGQDGAERVAAWPTPTHARSRPCLLPPTPLHPSSPDELLPHFVTVANGPVDVPTVQVRAVAAVLCHVATACSCGQGSWRLALASHASGGAARRQPEATLRRPLRQPTGARRGGAARPALLSLA